MTASPTFVLADFIAYSLDQLLETPGLLVVVILVAVAVVAALLDRVAWWRANQIVAARQARDRAAVQASQRDLRRQLDAAAEAERRRMRAALHVTEFRNHQP